MQATPLRRILFLAGLLSLFVSYSGLWLRFINDPVERTGSDFIAFYSAGRIAQEHGSRRVYNVDLQQQVQQEEVGFQLVEGQVLLYNHLPFLIPILQGIVSPNYVASFYRWIDLLIALYVAAVVVLSLFLRQAQIDRTSILLTAVGALLFLPVFFSLMNGQDTAFLFLGVALWIYGLVCDREIFAGLGLSLAVVRPHIALLLAIPMLFHDRKVFVLFLFGSGTLALLSLFVLGPNGIQEFINILVISAGGEWYGMKENAMYNLIGLLARALPQIELGSLRALGWIVYGITVFCLCLLWGRKTNFDDGSIGLTVILALFVAPHLHFHDLALLLIPIYDIVWIGKKMERFKISGVVMSPVAMSFLLLLSNLSPLLQYTTPYLIMLALAIYPYFLKSRMAVITPRQS
jgi:hypothetical protein